MTPDMVQILIDSLSAAAEVSERIAADENIAVISLIATVFTTVGLVVVAYFQNRLTKETRSVHIQFNERMDELVELQKAASFKAGQEKERAEQAEKKP